MEAAAGGPCAQARSGVATATPGGGRRPESGSERYLAALWSEVIGLEGVTASDRFLDVGGNSLTLNIILNRIRTEKGVSLDARPFFDSDRSSLAALAEQLDAASAKAGRRDGGNT